MNYYRNLQTKDIKGEFWTKTKESETHYVSNYGRIKSIPKEIVDKNNVSRRVKAKDYILTQEELKTGYLRVCINNKRYLVHRIVLNAFKGIGDNLVVNHIDNNKKNNCINNLEDCTQKQNVNHYWNNYAK
jgi:hypothetical protein